ncbi:MAG: hypothetical protein DCC67_20520 [Planctomycetota bacterium]|nr:MAG: hypothetical protein DCC67_20520 [Planctomycetota bacterium]
MTSTPRPAPCSSRSPREAFQTLIRPKLPVPLQVERLTGIRREQSATRKNTAILQKDHLGLLKICPIARWTAKDVHYYLQENGLPYHPLREQGYLSIGCHPEEGYCTSKVKPGQDPRSGRWAGFDKTGDILYLLDSRGRDTSALFALNLNTDEKLLLAENPKADVGEVLVHPTEKTIQAVGFTYARREWKILDESIKKDLDYLATVEDGELLVTSRTLDDQQWTCAYLLDNGPVKFYRYDRANQKAHFLFNSRDDLDGYPLVNMHAPIIDARDGKKLVCYLSLPKGSDPDGDGKPDKPVPMVLNVHGGPWARDEWGYDAEHQWLANRGYAVLAVNYRGSTGFGKSFVNAANGEWSRKMHEDLIDAVNWAVKNGVAQQDKVAIMGGSYGGYATLVGLTFTPDVFACGVDIVGPSSLVTLLQNVPPYWAPFMPVMKIRVGDVDTEEGRQALLERSPLTLVDKIKKPLLIGQGANDPRVTQLEADQIVEAMQARNIPVTYVLYPDEGHGFALQQNRMSFNAVAEAFLAEHLGGRFEPVGDDFEASSIHIPRGVTADGRQRRILPPAERQIAEAKSSARKRLRIAHLLPRIFVAMNGSWRYFWFYFTGASASGRR